VGRGAASLALAFIVLCLGSRPVRADACTEQAVAVERERSVPLGLLHAIALAESGYNGQPHPYALRIGRKSLYPANPEQALRLLIGSKGHAPRYANVGCMQLALPGRHRTVAAAERMLDPAINMRAAASYLIGWQATTGSWTAAVSHFQGGGPRARQAYVCRIWNYLHVLQPTSAETIDARRCVRARRPSIDPATIALAERLRAAAPAN
jgi:hypothetical protein